MFKLVKNGEAIESSSNSNILERFLEDLSRIKDGFIAIFDNDGWRADPYNMQISEICELAGEGTAEIKILDKPRTVPFKSVRHRCFWDVEFSIGKSKFHGVMLPKAAIFPSPFKDIKTYYIYEGAGRQNMMSKELPSAAVDLVGTIFIKDTIMKKYQPINNFRSNFPTQIPTDWK